MANDRLTNLFFYDDFKEKAQELLGEETAQRVIISMNIKNFRYINKHYGFDIGDAVLKKVADAIYGADPKCLAGCRVHSDRFIFFGEADTNQDMVLKVQLIHELERVAENICTELEIAKLHFNVGAYLFRNNDENISEALDKAEYARKLCQQDYKDYVLIFDDKLMEEEKRKRNMIPTFQRALKDGRILMPKEFLPYLETAGLVTELDQNILKLTCGLFQKWVKEERKLIKLGINVSGTDFREERVFRKMVTFVRRANIPVEYLTIEIKEKDFYDEGSNLHKKIELVKKTGATVYIDDFGSGYSSLHAIGNLPADEVKLSAAFVQNCGSTKKGITIMTGLIEIFSNIGYKVVSKGIENMLEKRIVASCGCDTMQGFVYDKPMPIEEFEQKYMKK